MAKKQAEQSQNDASNVNEEMPSIISYSEDIADAEAPEPLPAGEYLATIEGAQIKTSTNTGNDYVSVTFRIAPEEFPADFDVNNAPEGVVLSYNRLSPADQRRARYAMRQFIERIGAELGGSTVQLHTWQGLTARLTLKVTEYEGIPRNEIDRVNPA